METFEEADDFNVEDDDWTSPYEMTEMESEYTLPQETIEPPTQETQPEPEPVPEAPPVPVSKT